MSTEIDMHLSLQKKKDGGGGFFGYARFDYLGVGLRSKKSNTDTVQRIDKNGPLATNGDQRRPTATNGDQPIEYDDQQLGWLGTVLPRSSERTETSINGD